MSELGIGEEFAGHRIEGVAGRGGMGIVYKALDLRLKRLVAMKVIAPELAQDAEFRERFERESQLAASLDHMNVIPIHHAGEEGGTLFITMRYVQGTDLSAMIARDGRVDPERVVKMLYGIAGALDAAHSEGLIHRDVKPANILIEKHEGRDHVYLTDFGLTKQTGSSGPTRTGFAVGTFDYMAPEQFLAQAIDARADVYALGCVLFEALTGRVPFPRPGDAARMYAHIQEEPPRPSATAAGLPPAFDDVVLRALAKEPEDRYASAGDLASAAGGAAGGVQPETAVSRPPSAPAVPVPSTPLPTSPPAPPPSPPPATSTPSPPPASVPPAPSNATRASAPIPTPAPEPAPTPAPAIPSAGPVTASGSGSRGPSRGLILGGGVVVAIVVILVIALMMGGGESGPDTTTPDGTVTAFLADLADGDGNAACELMTPEAQQQAIDAPGVDCAATALALSGADDEGKAGAIRDASFVITPNGDTAGGYVDLPDPQQATLGTAGSRQIFISLTKSGEQWLISDFSGFCSANNTFC